MEGKGPAKHSKREHIDIEYEKAPSHQQPKRLKQATLTHSLALSRTPFSSKTSAPCPPEWQRVWNLIKEMRENKTAPVDSMGCHALASTDVPTKVTFLSCLVTPLLQDFRFQTLVGLMLSSQTRDSCTASAMEKLKARGLTAENIVQMEESVLQHLISKVTFAANKARNIKKTAQIVKDKYRGEIPDTLEGLQSLPGVGPKMAILCLQHAFGRTVGIGVDVHVHRICNRLGWVKTKEPESTRKELEKWLPIEYWGQINRLFVGFGQTVCGNIPKCYICKVNHICPSAFAIQ